MFQEKYAGFIEGAVPEPALVDRVAAAGREQDRGSIRILRTLRKPAIAVAALLALVFGGIPALAANVPMVYELMYLVSPATAQFFMPVQKASEDNGIRMEVVATYIHEDMAEIYVTMQDLAGDRVDATTDLYDSYSINRPFDSAGYCERVGYDEDTGTATFLIRINEWGGHNITGDKITFTVRCFLSNKQRYENIPLEVDLGEVGEAAGVRQVFDYSGWGLDTDPWEDQEPSTILGDANLAYFPVEDFQIVAAGFIDGRLHVQMTVDFSLEKDNHGWLHLEDDSGAILEPSSCINYDEPLEQEGYHSRRVYDYVFDVGPEEAAEYRLHGSFTTSGSYTEGEWRVTFPLVQSE